jgi:hypothetical protein
MENFDWKFREVQGGNIPSGARLVLKVVDANDDVSYALGVYDRETSKFRFTAQENPEAHLVVAWMMVP